MARLLVDPDDVYSDVKGTLTADKFGVKFGIPFSIDADHDIHCGFAFFKFPLFFFFPLH